MNAKKVKQLRKTLKSEGIDVNHALYDLRKVINRFEEEKHVITLSKTSGRSLYKRAKELAKNGTV